MIYISIVRLEEIKDLYKKQNLQVNIKYKNIEYMNNTYCSVHIFLEFIGVGG